MDKFAGISVIRMEISNNVIKWVYSLSQKKNRQKERCFVAEGTKCVLDTVSSFEVKTVFATRDWIDAYASQLHTAVTEATRPQLERMSMLKTAPDVLAVYQMPEWVLADDVLLQNLSIVLDGVQDPGNLGTIIRIADWFGIRHVICSEDTADVFNPKTVQATMGAISRVEVTYCNLPQLFDKFRGKLPVYGTFLDGRNIYDEPLSGVGFIVMGNEGKGISKKLEKYMTDRLLIPSYPSGRVTSESLNVGMATAVVVGEFRRRMM